MKICKEKHPTGLHGFKPKREGVKKATCTGVQLVSCASTKFRSDVIRMCVVPVQIHHPDSSKVLYTYAMLANSSQGTFAKEEIIEVLGIIGAGTRVTVKKLNGKISLITTVVENLKVAGLLGKPKWIKLLRAYTKQALPVDEQETATPEKVKRWNYVEGTANETCPSTDISVGLLIGATCVEALEPKEVISSRESGPYTVKTILGWCVVGPISCTSESGDKVSCYHVSVEEAGSCNLGKHHFCILNEVKDTGIKDMLNKIYHAHFTEAVQPRRFDKMLNLSDEPSREDQRFLRLMEKEVTTEDGHYQLPLPFRKGNRHWPNNRVQAKMWLQGLKKRFMKDYSNFMEDLFQKGYAEGSPNTSDGNKWYILHHGVYQPAQPGKIRVVFDCCVEYLGYALNKQLIPGPDLTNQITGVLIRFREEQVAIMGDIEAMFYQAQIAECQPKILWLLWSKATTSTINQLIIRYVFMYLEVHHHHVVAIMHSKEQQLTLKSRLV